jgi:hypothetical protein
MFSAHSLRRRQISVRMWEWFFHEVESRHYPKFLRRNTSASSHILSSFSSEADTLDLPTCPLNASIFWYVFHCIVSRITTVLCCVPTDKGKHEGYSRRHNEANSPTMYHSWERPVPPCGVPLWVPFIQNIWFKSSFPHLPSPPSHKPILIFHIVLLYVWMW